MEFVRSKKGISVSQRKYTIDLWNETGMLDSKPSKTPIDLKDKRKMFEGNPVDKERYQQLVGKLIYLSHTIPNIAFAVSLVSQYMHDPCQGHLNAVYRILRYLKQTPGKGLFFIKTTERKVEVFVDADSARSVDDRKPTSGYCTIVWGNVVIWRSKKQTVVGRSIAEAEYRASSISIAHNPIHHDRTKHVEVDRHFIKEKIDGGIVSIKYVHMDQQLADILTKGLSE
ncbi:secreted RxLR effector protein 161-like [Humulus lupulus]|uniref:secreted RxLR effector protein 161-like n=1 Tax=Humulus lupulus TaxID=3486 RepID=UPI002B4111C3|nr:secreted RxLR effector protein 161-like [Humulus lupulus]